MKLKLAKEAPIDAEPTFIERLHRLEASYELNKQQMEERVYILEEAVNQLLKQRKQS
jgi:hypothetical protein